MELIYGISRIATAAVLRQGKLCCVSLPPSLAYTCCVDPFSTSFTAGATRLDMSSIRSLPDFGTLTMHLDDKSKALAGGRAACKVSGARFS